MTENIQRCDLMNLGGDRAVLVSTPIGRIHVYVDEEPRVIQPSGNMNDLIGGLRVLVEVSTGKTVPIMHGYSTGLCSHFPHTAERYVRQGELWLCYGSLPLVVNSITVLSSTTISRKGKSLTLA